MADFSGCQRQKSAHTIFCYDIMFYGPEQIGARRRVSFSAMFFVGNAAALVYMALWHGMTYDRCNSSRPEQTEHMQCMQNDI